MSQVPVKYVDPCFLIDPEVVVIDSKTYIPVVPLSALREWLKRLDDDMRAAGFDAPTEAQRLLASLDAEGVQ